MTPDEIREQSERALCPACRERRVHSQVEWANHPAAGLGQAKGEGRPVERVES